MPKDKDQHWDEVLSAASRLQEYLPGAVLVGGTVAAIYAKHRMSVDDDHVMDTLKEYFDDVLEKLESVAGWKTARVNKPVLILGNLDGIETGVRQLIRTRPLETKFFFVDADNSIVLPTPAEILRIKAVLILKRNAVRDYVDFAAMADYIGINEAADVLRQIEEYYPENGNVLQQLTAQLSEPLPYDLDSVDLSQYKGLVEQWHTWSAVAGHCKDVAKTMMRLALDPS